MIKMSGLQEPVILPVPDMNSVRETAARSSYSVEPPRTYPAWAPRFWHGMDFFTWMRLLARNRFAVSPNRLPLATWITVASVLNSFAGVFDRLMFESLSPAHAVEGAAAIRARPLAQRHDTVARVVDARFAAHLPEHVPVL